MKGIEKIYSNYFPTNSFDDLNIPLYVSATDLLKGETTFFSSGNLSKALMASSCIPFVFQPIKFNNSYYVDGGVLDNFPIEPLIGQCDLIIGISVNSYQVESEKIHMKNVIDRSVHLSLSNTLIQKKN